MNLAAEMSRLPEPPNDSKPPLWDAWRHDLWKRAQNDDPHNFMRWPCVYHTMLQDHWPDSIIAEIPYVKAAIGEFSFLPDGISDRWPSMDDVNAGLKTNRILSSYRNLIHQAYHILRWQEATGLKIADMQSIYEFGGGYGAMALVCNRLGFKGDYYIYDLPEFALLQQWYLIECGAKNGVKSVAWIDKLPDEFKSVDLFIACYSLSETDYQQRIEHLMTYRAKSFLLLYSNKFEQYDNIEFFQDSEWPRYLSAQNWQHSRIEHLPPESWYSFGY